MSRSLLLALLLLPAVAVPCGPEDFNLLAHSRSVPKSDIYLSAEEQQWVFRERGTKHLLEPELRNLPAAERDRLLEKVEPTVQSFYRPTRFLEMTPEERQRITELRGSRLLLGDPNLSIDEVEAKAPTLTAKAWMAAYRAYTTPNPLGTRIGDGRKVNIPEDRRDRLIDELNSGQDRMFYLAPVTGDFVTFGNQLHMGDYRKLIAMNTSPDGYKFPNGAIQDMFGIDPKDIELFRVAHDYVKSLSPRFGDATGIYAPRKLGGKFASMEYAIGLHGHESLRAVAEVVRSLGEQNGWTADEQVQHFYAIADLVGDHNFGLDVSDPSPDRIRSRYPSLTATEASLLAGSFYEKLANTGGIFGPVGVNPRMGFAPSDHSGAERGVLSRDGINLDRGTIVTSWMKVATQNLGSQDFTPDFAQATFASTAKGALAQLKAVADLRQKDILPRGYYDQWGRVVDKATPGAIFRPGGYFVDVNGNSVAESTPGATFKPYTVADLPSNQFFEKTAKHWLSAAAKLERDNSPVRRRQAGLADHRRSDGKMTYEKALLYRPKEKGVEYRVWGNYSLKDGKKVYELKAEMRALSADGTLASEWQPAPHPATATDPMAILGHFMVHNGDLPNPL